MNSSAKIFYMKLIQLVETRRLVLASTLGPIVTKVLRQLSHLNSRGPQLAIAS